MMSVRKSFKGALGGKGYVALALLALVLAACGGSSKPATTTTTTTSSAAPSSAGTSSAAPSSAGTSSAGAPLADNALPGTGRLCLTSSPTGICGPYRYAADTNSNGYNTYVGNNCWGDPSCVQTAVVRSPGNWQVTATQPARNGSVRTAPEIGQQFNNWCGGGKDTWSNFVPNGCGASADTLISALSELTSRYAESTPHNSRTIAQWAWDNWLSNDAGYASEVMVWVDVSGRCNSGSFGTQVHSPVKIAGQVWTPHRTPIAPSSSGRWTAAAASVPAPSRHPAPSTCWRC